MSTSPGEDDFPPLTIAFDVACSDDHAFSTWTERIGTWWPRDHTLTGALSTDVVLQPWVGGRIYERDSDGVEHLWGHVTVWQPPTRLSYLWHLGRDPAEATDVDITFAGRSSTATTVQIVHHGWQRLGATAGVWREHNQAGWDSVLPHYLAAIQGE